MKEAWNCYLMAFKNAFDYKSTATRKELNWFIAFFVLFGIILNISSIFLYMMISIGVIGNNIKIAFATVILWAIYLIIHIILLTTLIKRRFNYITPNKTNLLFSLWIIAFAILLAFSFYIAIMFISMGSHIEIKFNPEWMSPIILLLSFAMPILKPLVLGTIIFLMIREKPVN